MRIIRGYDCLNHSGFNLLYICDWFKILNILLKLLHLTRKTKEKSKTRVELKDPQDLQTRKTEEKSVTVPGTVKCIDNGHLCNSEVLSCRNIVRRKDENCIGI